MPYGLELDPGVFTLLDGPGGLNDITIMASRNSQPVEFTIPLAPGLVGFMTSLPVGEVSDLRILPAVVFNNPYPVPVTTRMDFFNAETGQGQALRVDGGSPQTSHEFQLPANSGARYELSHSGTGLLSAWGVITSSVAGLTASVIYSTFSTTSGDLMGEAGVTAALARNHLVLSVAKTADGLDTAVAIANPTSGP